MFRTVDNHLFFSEHVGGDVLPVCAAMHNLTHKQLHNEITLDFTSATSFDAAFMVALSTIARSYRGDMVHFDIILPRNTTQARLLRNANWLHLISPEKFEDRTTANKNHFSAFQFLDVQQQDLAVVRCIDVLMQRVEGLHRNKLKALEWSLTEVTDNVLNHAASPVGGVVQAISRPTKHRVDFFVCDAGIGIPRSLRQGRPDIQDDTLAVKAAIEEGVTKNKTTNQGNGLFGTFKCCEVSGGEFEILTGNIRLTHSKTGLHVRRTTIPFHGTFIKASIDYSFDKLLEKALVFRGRPHDPAFDHVERFYQPHGEQIEVLVQTEFNSFGSREAGKLARTKIENLMDSGHTPIMFDFNGIHLISSSFADEVFGKLFAHLGPLRFGQLCQFRNVDSTVQTLIDRAISQRMRV
ncbi:STAS-like domain-containing protein [Enterovirga aerilata]|uniref:DUF4325 domain-containing protein n=1 Tax=Enterovirga aerilata TaxID=2730920 RepID=A0A849IA64_9HYPH|nr:STAS-like domain-containing protein [Enterovirga sp. DB1703]NNM72897.1 DUF4325 domain-containing protein [Enterovirga sp. DB1703]